MTDLCAEYTSSGPWGGEVCGRPVKAEGMCGIHLRAKRLREERRTQADERTAEQNRIQQEMDRACELLRERGITATPYYQNGWGSRSGGYVRKVIVDPAEVLAKLQPR